MKILLSGAHGLVGSALAPALMNQGRQVHRLVRSPTASDAQILWNPPQQGPDPARLEGLDAVVHLAGENIAGRWTESKKRAIRDSRVRGTQLLVEALSRAKAPPRVFISASAVGYYGDRGPEVLTEESAPGRGFLSEVCRDWEAASQPLTRLGVRVLWLRFGVILSPRGGALAKMLLPFKLGIGGKIGSGKQYMSWIALDDGVALILHALENPGLEGPVNAVAPEPVTNAVFTKTLGKALRRPTPFPLPAFAARLAFGQMADELLLASARVTSKKILASGFRFRYSTLEAALYFFGRRV